jgi:hypothetical protein
MTLRQLTRLSYALLALAASAGCGPREFAAYKAGDTVTGRKFEITVHSVTKESRLAVSGALDPVADDTEQFIVIDASVMNMGTTARTFATGNLHATVAGKRLVFDRETVGSSQYANVEKIDPLRTIRKKIAFRVPRQAAPPFTWTPGPSDVRIQLAEAISVSKRLGDPVDQRRAPLPRLQLTSAVAGPPAALEVRLASEMPYAEARRMLLDAGWRPMSNARPEMLESGAKALFQDGAVEVQSCAENGVVPCKFGWIRPGNPRALMVFTEGARPQVSAWTFE